MIMSRSAGAAKKGSNNLRSSTSSAPKIPTLQSFLTSRDYTGALALLEFNRGAGGDDDEVTTLMWIGYCAFHLGRYDRAQEVYTDLLAGTHGECPTEVGLYLACVYYYMSNYKEAEKAAKEAPDSSLKNRILFHVYHKLGDEHSLMQVRNEGHTRANSAVNVRLSVGEARSESPALIEPEP